MKKTKSIGYWIGIILAFILIIAISWAITCGIIKLVTLCFGIAFNLAMATGIWLILWLLGSVFRK